MWPATITPTLNGLAGIAHPDYVVVLSDAVFDRSMAVNYGGALDAVRAVLPGMKARRRDNIVLVSSGLGLVGMIGCAAYAPASSHCAGWPRSCAMTSGPRASRCRWRIRQTPIRRSSPPTATKPPETRAITAGAKTWSADGVATAIMKGIERRRFAITPGWEMTALYWLHSIAAPLVAGHFDRTVAKVRRQRSR